MKIIKVIIGVMIVCISLLILFVGSEPPQKIIYECVDGDGGVNLEGFMCEKEVHKFIGLTNEEGGSILLFIFMLLVIIGILLMVAGTLEKK